DNDAAPESDRPTHVEQQAEQVAADQRTCDPDHDVGDATEATPCDDSRGDGAGDESDHNPCQPGARVWDETSRERKQGARDRVHDLASHFSMIEKTSSLP